VTAPTWADWQTVSTTDAKKSVSRTPASTLNTQRSTQKKLVTKTADRSPLSIVYGNTWCGGKIDYIKQQGSHLVIRALFCVGEVESVDEVRINDASYATGDYMASPDFKGDYTTWAGLQTLPVDIVGGWIFTHSNNTYRVKESITVLGGDDLANYSPSAAIYLYEVLLTNVEINIYTGTQAQGIDPILLGYEPTYNETLLLAGTLDAVCYAVIKIPLAQYGSGLPNITARIRGRKVFDPRTTTTVYSDNPALCLADLITSTTYGMGFSVDNASLAIAANYCDEVVAGEPRSSLNLELDQANQTASWGDVLRAYAFTFLDWNETVKFILDAPSAPTHTLKIAPEAGTDILNSVPTRKWLGQTQRPNRIRVIFTNPGNNYNDSSVIVETVDVASGATKERLSEIRMPGLLSEQQALNVGNRRLLAAQHESWDIDFNVLDIGIEIDAGDVINIETVSGTNPVPARVLNRSMTSIGRYSLIARQYKEEVYA